MPDNLRPLQTNARSATRAPVNRDRDARVLTHERFQRGTVGEPLLTKQQLAAALGVVPRTVDRWIQAGLPRDTPKKVGAWCVIGTRKRFRQAAVQAWHEDRAP